MHREYRDAQDAMLTKTHWHKHQRNMYALFLGARYRLVCVGWEHEEIPQRLHSISGDPICGVHLDFCTLAPQGLWFLRSRSRPRNRKQLGILGNSLVSAAPAAGAPADAESPVSLAFRIDLRKPTHHVGRQRGLSTSPGFRCQELSDQISKYMNDIIDR